MYRITILYGTPTDPGAFRKYYQEHHIPLARRMRGLTGWNLVWLEDDPTYILIAELYAADRVAMDAILASPEGEAARADLANFATGGVTFHAGLEVEVPLT